MNTSLQIPPSIFIHSLFRTSSTYFFDKFRSLGPEFISFKEPLHENLLCLNHRNRWSELCAPPDETSTHLRHPKLEKPYFYEYWVHRELLAGLFNQKFSYSRYFLADGEKLPKDLTAYIEALLTSDKESCPVLHFCRSTGRISAIKETFAGLHIYLWREPRIQWWSYKVSEYFDQATRKIYGSKYLPPALCSIKQQVTTSCDNKRYFPASENYMMFYALWLDAWLRGKAAADIVINVDSAGMISAENTTLSETIAQRLGRSLDLSDLRVSGMSFQPDEIAFYERIESVVHETFLRVAGATPQEIELSKQESQRARHAHTPEIAVQSNLRQLSMSMMERISKLERRSLFHRTST